MTGDREKEKERKRAVFWIGFPDGREASSREDSNLADTGFRYFGKNFEKGVDKPRKVCYNK